MLTVDLTTRTARGAARMDPKIRLLLQSNTQYFPDVSLLCTSLNVSITTYSERIRTTELHVCLDKCWACSRHPQRSVRMSTSFSFRKKNKSRWNYYFSCHHTRDEISQKPIVVVWWIRIWERHSLRALTPLPPCHFPLHPDRSRQLLCTPRRCPPCWHQAFETWASDGGCR